ncbi:MAG: anthranilate phosphoribosyltransferase family protein [Elainellaceae cyanobacterium]
MSNAFRDLLRKIGSGSHTSEHLSRAEAAAATQMILQQEATPAQIGAFMIAHRIKRPTGEELAGMLDAYHQLGPHLKAISASYPTLVFSLPYDGRSRTAPISVLTALILTTAHCPVILHGGRRMPTKYGIPLIEIWQALGIDWTLLTLNQVQAMFNQTHLGFVYLPHHFPLADDLVPYRDQIGKRPPFATLELIWCPYDGEAILVSGFVHPPTEHMIQEALAHHDMHRFITVKGLEGSCDLPRDRTCIIGIGTTQPQPHLERLLLHPRDYGFAGKEVPLGSPPELITDIQAALSGEATELARSAIWNGGFYLWQSGVCPTAESGLAKAREILMGGLAAETLDKLRMAIATLNGNPSDILVKTN